MSVITFIVVMYITIGSIIMILAFSGKLIGDDRHVYWDIRFVIARILTWPDMIRIMFSEFRVIFRERRKIQIDISRSTYFIIVSMAIIKHAGFDMYRTKLKDAGYSEMLVQHFLKLNEAPSSFIRSDETYTERLITEIKLRRDSILSDYIKFQKESTTDATKIIYVSAASREIMSFSKELGFIVDPRTLYSAIDSII